MVTEVTKGIRISVDTQFQPDHSNAKNSLFLFSYRVQIENCSEEAVQLLSRKWLIMDANGFVRKVEGEGVIGEQPIIEPGETHQYSSSCDLNTDMGKMWGTYLMQRVNKGDKFRVNIPEFKMMVPHRLN
jgi:ApaG protein